MSLQDQPEGITLVAEPDQRPNDEDKPDRPSRLLPVSIGLVVLAALGGVVWYAYSWFGDDGGDVPVIRAEAGSGKSRPENPGGLEVAHQDKLVLNNPTPDHETPQVERLLPPPEVPKPPAPVAPKQLATPPEVPKPPAPTQPSASAPAITKPSDTEPSGTKAPLTTKPIIIGNRPLFPKTNQGGQAPAQAAGDLVVPPPPAVPATPPTQTAARPVLRGSGADAAGGGGPTGLFAVQLASLRAADRATVAWKRLQETFPSLLGDRTLFVEEVDLGARGNFYRIQAESFRNRAEAAALCDALKARKQDCLVVKR